MHSNKIVSCITFIKIYYFISYTILLNRQQIQSCTTDKYIYNINIIDRYLTYTKKYIVYIIQNINTIITAYYVTKVLQRTHYSTCYLLSVYYKQCSVLQQLKYKIIDMYINKQNYQTNTYIKIYYLQSCLYIILLLVLQQLKYKVIDMYINKQNYQTNKRLLYHLGTVLFHTQVCGSKNPKFRSNLKNASCAPATDISIQSTRY
eukprot:TRINITY_DN1349_c0_g1_i4.p2 TRINITY_DN1349_c0_g1~~TRINITY_DN1349_c0_g1_i4.p2  ORF type:complete len:204 (-),score=-27.79 TRINITY_DN1349_c0_g1_i4:913-1524(-)